MEELTLRILDEKARVLLVGESKRAVLLAGEKSRKWVSKKALSLSTGHLERWFVELARKDLQKLFEHPITDDNVVETTARELLKRKKVLEKMRLRQKKRMERKRRDGQRVSRYPR